MLFTWDSQSERKNIEFFYEQNNKLTYADCNKDIEKDFKYIITR